VDVVLGVDAGGGQRPGRRPVGGVVRPPPDRLGQVDHHRRRPHRDARRAGGRHPPVLVEGDQHPDAAERVVAVAAGDLPPGAAAAGRRPGEDRLGGQLPRAQRGLQRADEEPVGGDRPASTGGGQLHRPAEQRQHRRQLAGRVGVHQAADHRAAVADGGVGQVGQGLPQQRHRAVGVRVVLDLGVAGHRADPHRLGVGADVGQLRQPVDVDQVRRRGQAHVQQRHQALPARQDLAVVAGVVEDRERLLDGGGAVVLERGWFHRLPTRRMATTDGLGGSAGPSLGQLLPRGTVRTCW
jgi:hypothetical protein